MLKMIIDRGFSDLWQLLLLSVRLGLEPITAMVPRNPPWDDVNENYPYEERRRDTLSRMIWTMG